MARYSDSRRAAVVAKIMQPSAGSDTIREMLPENGRGGRREAARQLVARLLRLNQLLVAEPALDHLYTAVLRIVEEVIEAERTELQLLDASETRLVLVAARGLPSGMEVGDSAPCEAGLAGWVLARRQPALVARGARLEAEVQRLVRTGKARVEGSMLCVPLVARAQPLGVLAASRSAAQRPFTADDLELLTLLAGQIALAVAQARLHERTTQLATTDVLTGLLNHRAFQERFEVELDRAARTRSQLALLLLDLDEFKRLNDLAGHAAGDQLLRLVARRAILANIRPYDVAARLGGDEFGIVLPQTSAPQARLVGERIRRAVAALGARGALPEGMDSVSVSIGVAHFPSDGLRREDLQEVAGKGLQYAKYLGKNQLQRGAATLATFERDPMRLQQLLEGSNHAVIEALAAAVDARDTYTAGHSRRVADYAVALARSLGFEDAFCQQVRLAALFHDVGKIGIPDAVLRKPGPLTEEEHALVRQHPVIGADQVLVHVPFLRAQLPAIRHHHERWDGRGYPDQLAGEEIPYMARLLAVADSYDAMTSTRVYRQALLFDDVLRILATGAGRQWDPELTAAWLRYLRDHGPPERGTAGQR